MAEIGRVTGGHVARATIRSALKAQGITSLKVGFFKSAKYPDGTPVAAVAAWNEFGTRQDGRLHIPERPFFRRAIEGAVEPVREILLDEIDPEGMAVNEGLADLIGAFVAGQVQASIVRLKEPPNAPVTIEMKGSSNPLVDEGKMKDSVTWSAKR